MICCWFGCGCLIFACGVFCVVFFLYFVFGVLFFLICHKALQVLCDMKYTEVHEGSSVSCNCSKYLGATITSKAEVFCSSDGRPRMIF